MGQTQFSACDDGVTQSRHRQVRQGRERRLDRIGKVSFVMRHARPVDQRCGERHDIGGTVEFGRHPDTVAG